MTTSTQPQVQSKFSALRVKQGASTASVHAGEQRPYPYHSLSVPIVQTATYTFENTQDLCDFQEAHLRGDSDGRIEYGRYGNPTVAACEAKLAALDHGEDAILFSSGMAAITSVLLSMLPTGAHVVMTNDSYRRTRQFCLSFLKRLGITTTIVPLGDFDALEAALQPNTRVIISESPTNPYLRVMDLIRLAEVGRRHGIKTLIDSTFATPINQCPIDFGIDLVVHSATKYLSGHNDLLAGVVIGEAGLIGAIRQSLGVLGAIADPHNAALLLRGLKSLGLRVAKQNENGLRVAEFLEAQPRAKRVWYPGLPSHPDYAIARSQMLGWGGVVSFEIDGSLQETSRFIDALQIPIIAPSLGGTETLIEQPALMSYYELSTEERSAIGISDSLVRLAIGIEDAEDLIADLAQGFESF
jgi:cystathionine gamma-synthase